jgi:molecular chaperone DnaK (HSP70)
VIAADDIVVGIDLGTTNSEVAAYLGDRVQVLGPADAKVLPSCVGLTPDGELLVGKPARHQQLVYPERTVRSIKRKMGAETRVTLGDRSFTPPEVSAVILRALAQMAERELGQPVRRAVITVPAYFSDAQRQATREAGELAGLEVVRILNEPTAASLAYGFGAEQARTVMVYDLGGGTFDVSIVRVEGDVTEVLASHGNNELGGDDFDRLLLDKLLGEFEREHGERLDPGGPARARLLWAAEEAKRQLSYEPYARLREEALLVAGGKPLHLDREVSRDEYEELIRPLVESTLVSVTKALDDSRTRAADLDAILLVGGSTRTPLVAGTLLARTGIEPHREVHPDLCVALGAGVLAARLAGRAVERVLVDVSPFSFGPSFLGMRGGVPYPHCYRPVISRNTPLPVTRVESYWTAYSGQPQVNIEIYQGEDDDALKNIPVGDFHVVGLDREEEENEILCRMRLDLDGLLRVAAIERHTGKSKEIVIRHALTPKTPEEVAAARERLRALFEGSGPLDAMFDAAANGEGRSEAEIPGLDALDAPASPSPADDGGWSRVEAEALASIERSRAQFPQMHEEDREDAIDLHERIEAALAAQDAAALGPAVASLKELLFFIEGR